MPGMIWGKVLRSPHPHARIKSIDTSKAEALPGVKAVVTSKGHRRLPDRQGRGHARHPGHALDVPQRDGARQGAVPRPPRRRRRRDHGSDRSRSLQADRGRLRGAALGDRDRRCDQARRADPARVQQVRRQALQHRRQARESRRATSPKACQGRGRDRAQLHHAPGASGLYRAACLPDLGRAPTARPRSGARARASSWSAR